MATLTSTYQYLGRSTGMVNQGYASYYYYILIYGKTVANNATGFHTVSIRQVLACDSNSSFYQYSTSYNGKIDGTQVFSGANKPDQAWETTPLVAGDVTYPRWTVIGEGSTKVDCTDGKAHNIELSTYWKLHANDIVSYLPFAQPERTVAVTATLPAIPRATGIDSFSCATSYLDGTLTYKYTPQSASYYNRMTLNILVDDVRTELRTTNLGKKSAAQQTATTVFTAAELSAIYAKIPNAASVTVQLRIGTYSDSNYSTKIGDTQMASITLTVPTAVKPTVSMTATLVNNNAWIAARNLYVAGYSGATFTMTAKPGEGASLSSTTITTPDNITYEAVKLNVERIKKSGNLTFTAKATDSRNRSTSVSKVITVLPYSAPILSNFSAERGTYNSGWTASDGGPDVKVSFKATLSLADNGNVYSATFKLDGAAVAPAAGTTTGLASGANCTVYLKNVDAEISHSLIIATADAVGNSAAVSITIPTKNITIEFNASGKGIAFGKPSEKDVFECAWDAEFSGALRKMRSDGTALEIDDTGWIELGTSDAVTTEGAGTGRNGPGCFYRVVNGNHVYVAFCVLFTYEGSAIQVNANAIPSKFRPARKAYTLNTIGGYRLARVGVNGSGNVVIDWAQDLINGGVQTTSTPSIWIDGYVDYWLD